MIAVGIQRRLDELGRIVLPMEMRKSLGIRDGDKMNITAQGNVIMLEKYEESDCFTGDTDDLIDYKGKKVSKASILELARLAGIVKE